MGFPIQQLLSGEPYNKSNQFAPVGAGESSPHKETILVLLISTQLVLSGCMFGTTANYRLPAAVTIYVDVVYSDREEVVPAAVVRVTRFFPGLLGSYIPLYEGKTDVLGHFEYKTELNGIYNVWVSPPDSQYSGEVLGVANLTEDVPFIFRLKKK